MSRGKFSIEILLFLCHIIVVNRKNLPWFLFLFSFALILCREPAMQLARHLGRPVNELATDKYVQEKILNIPRGLSAEKEGVWRGLKVALPETLLADIQQTLPVLGENTEEKWVEIDLSQQKLYAREGDRVVFEFPISSGLPWTPTVTGEFRVWHKNKAQLMSGGSKENGSYYYLPNVPFNMYFYKGFAMHGTYWHNDFGKPRSHGCVNMRTEDAKALYYWISPQTESWGTFATESSPGTRVVVHGTTPTQNIW